MHEINRVEAAHLRPAKMTIRDAVVTDVETLFEIRCSVAENHMSREQLARIGISPESVGQMIAGRDYLAPIIEENGEAVAFAMAEISRSYVFAVFVRQGHDNKGYGRAVLGAVEGGLRARGVRRAWLCTGGDLSLRAHGFYRRLGWTPTGAMPDGQVRYEKNLG